MVLAAWCKIVKRKPCSDEDVDGKRGKRGSIHRGHELRS